MCKNTHAGIFFLALSDLSCNLQAVQNLYWMKENSSRHLPIFQITKCVHYIRHQMCIQNCDEYLKISQCQWVALLSISFLSFLNFLPGPGIQVTYCSSLGIPTFSHISLNFSLNLVSFPLLTPSLPPLWTPFKKFKLIKSFISVWSHE